MKVYKFTDFGELICIGYVVETIDGYIIKHYE